MVRAMKGKPKGKTVGLCPTPHELLKKLDQNLTLKSRECAISGKVLKGCRETFSKVSLQKGFTLLEVTIALGLWLILSMGVFLVWQHSARESAAMIERQSAFENARLAMDAFIMNLQLAREVTLQTDGNDNLQRLTLLQLNPDGVLHNYRFDFNVNAAPGSVRFQRLEFGDNEFAAGLAEIRITYVDQGMDIRIKTGCDEPIVLNGRACVRFKNVILDRR
jgi:prepilin-type N-terminal cleavage/methylation domain-containing protein